ncbi:MAG: DUF72 domain-containing protein [Acidobacteriota bacterium]|nr:DUF72 domain-containing protein [Acidobacteriota bacterium]
MIHVGTSGWSYPAGKGTWNGLFYPPPRAAGRSKFDEITYYAGHFDTVEVNSTFYRVQSPQTALSWVRRTPPGFLFSIKLFQKFTHPGLYLRKTGLDPWDLGQKDIDEFRAMLDPIAGAGKLGVLLAQFPASFQDDAAAREYIDWLLQTFRDYTMAVELRHKGWGEAGAEADAILARHGAGLVLIDEPRFATSIELDRALILAADRSRPLYLRLHGRNTASWWAHEQSEDRYNYLYAREELTPFVETAAEGAASGRKVFIYMNNHFSAKAVANAAIIKADLGQALPGEYPEAMIDRYPDLAGLVRVAWLPLLPKPS